MVHVVSTRVVSHSSVATGNRRRKICEYDRDGNIYPKWRTKSTSESHFAEFVGLWWWERWDDESAVGEIDGMWVMRIGGITLVSSEGRLW